jgi:para-nitrobenzyl esterase
MVRAGGYEREVASFPLLFTRRPLSVNPIAAPGVYHFAEIYYVFNNLNVMKDWPWQPSDRGLADAMSSYWTNFAKTGDPNGPGLQRWGAYNPGGDGQVMRLGESMEMQTELHRHRYEFLHVLYGKTGAR